MECKICGRKAEEILIQYMVMEYGGTVAIDGMVCLDCKNNITNTIRDFFTLKKDIEKILNAR